MKTEFVFPNLATFFNYICDNCPRCRKCPLQYGHMGCYKADYKAFKDSLAPSIIAIVALNLKKYHYKLNVHETGVVHLEEV